MIPMRRLDRPEEVAIQTVGVPWDVAEDRIHVLDLPPQAIRKALAGAAQATRPPPERKGPASRRPRHAVPVPGLSRPQHHPTAGTMGPRQRPAADHLTAVPRPRPPRKKRGSPRRPRMRSSMRFVR